MDISKYYSIEYHNQEGELNSTRIPAEIGLPYLLERIKEIKDTGAANIVVKYINSMTISEIVINTNIPVRNGIADLTGKEFQGRFGHDAIDAIIGPGKYRLPFKVYHHNKETDTSTQSTENIAVEVLAVFYEHGQNIVVTDGERDFFYIFYYNGAEQRFKPNWDYTDETEKVFEWIDIELEDKTPS